MAESIQHFPGSRAADVPATPGLYAWYYRPLALANQQDEHIASILGRFLDDPGRLQAQIDLRYHLHWEGQTTLQAWHGTDRRSVPSLVETALSRNSEFFRLFLSQQMTPIFSRPIYIGISNNLQRRVFHEHYQSLVGYWDTGSALSRFLNNRPQSSVQDVMEALGLSHSFALEARVRGIAPRDLTVFICETRSVLSLIDGEGLPEAEQDNQPNLRDVERVMQLLADPVCGRR